MLLAFWNCSKFGSSISIGIAAILIYVVTGLQLMVLLSYYISYDKCVSQTLGWRCSRMGNKSLHRPPHLLMAITLPRSRCSHSRVGYIPRLVRSR